MLNYMKLYLTFKTNYASKEEAKQSEIEKVDEVTIFLKDDQKIFIECNEGETKVINSKSFWNTQSFEGNVEIYDSIVSDKQLSFEETKRYLKKDNILDIDVFKCNSDGSTRNIDIQSLIIDFSDNNDESKIIKLDFVNLDSEEKTEKTKINKLKKKMVEGSYCLWKGRLGQIVYTEKNYLKIAFGTDTYRDLDWSEALKEVTPIYVRDFLVLRQDYDNVCNEEKLCPARELARDFVESIKTEKGSLNDLENLLTNFFNARF